MKKIIALLLMLALCVSMFVACGNDETGANETEKSGTKTEEPKVEESKIEEPIAEESNENTESMDVEKVVNEFFGALKILDGEKMASYVSDASYAEEAIAAFAQLSDFDSFAQVMAESIGDVSAFENDIKNFYNTLIAKVTSNISGKIDSNVKVGDDYHVSVTITFPNFGNGNPLEDMSSLLNEEAIMEVFMALYENGEISETMSEEELSAKLIPTVFNVITEAINEMEFTTVTESGIFVVSMVDGKWLIDMEKTDKINEE